MGYSGAWGKLIHEKNLKSKISWHCGKIGLTREGQKPPIIIGFNVGGSYVIYQTLKNAGISPQIGVLLS